MNKKLADIKSRWQEVNVTLYESIDSYLSERLEEVPVPPGRLEVLRTVVGGAGFFRDDPDVPGDVMVKTNWVVSQASYDAYCEQYKQICADCDRQFAWLFAASGRLVEEWREAHAKFPAGLKIAAGNEPYRVKPPESSFRWLCGDVCGYTYHDSKVAHKCPIPWKRIVDGQIVHIQKGKPDVASVT